jgi:bacterioferritin
MKRFHVHVRVDDLESSVRFYSTLFGSEPAVLERVTQLGGEPNSDPQGITDRSHSEYGRHNDLLTMIQEDLVAERVAIESCSEIVRWLGNDDPTTRRIMEDILKAEEEHADDMANLLAKMG